MPIPQITDAQIDEVIKIAPDESLLDPNKTRGRQHRGLLKLIRDYFAEQILGINTALIKKADLGTDNKILAAQMPGTFKYNILFPNEIELHGDYCNVSETVNTITKSPNILTVEYRTNAGTWKNIATGGNLPFTRIAGTYTDYRITFDLSGNRYGSLIIEGKENI